MQEKSVAIKIDKIVLVDIDKLKPMPSNRNKHGNDQIQRLAQLYKYQGMRTPIIVSNQSGFIVAGHGRHLAAIRAGLRQVPVSFQDFENAEQEYAFGVSDNAVSLWAELDKAGINEDLQEFNPAFDLDMLGILDFKLDLSEIEKKEKSKKEQECPECGHTF